MPLLFKYRQIPRPTWEIYGGSPANGDTYMPQISDTCVGEILQIPASK